MDMAPKEVNIHFLAILDHILFFKIWQKVEKVKVHCISLKPGYIKPGGGGGGGGWLITIYICIAQIYMWLWSNLLYI
jgi:hypothetical protein